jgi:iron(III) transport system ATP-binding protein
MSNTSASELAVDSPVKSKAGPVFAGHVALRNVGYSIQGKSILNDVSLDVRPGEVACLLGPSGCGKTTLLRLIAGIHKPDNGQILLDGMEISGPSRNVPPEKRNIGLVFQDFALFPHLSVIENVAYGLTALLRKEAMDVAALILERVGLGSSLQRSPQSLSGGEQQRVALARALVPRPQVVLLDEPFSGLDQRLKDTVREETLALLRETRATAILVTHDPVEALAFADHIHVMQSGKLAQSGKPDDLVHRPVSRDVAVFFRHYNFFEGVVRNGLVETLLGALPAKGVAMSGRVDVLVAPDGIRIVPQGQGTAATIVENRDIVTTRRILAKLHSNGQVLQIHSNVASTGEVGLVLTGKDTHIFNVS